jgi:hypothetical protein
LASTADVSRLGLRGLGFLFRSTKILFIRTIRVRVRHCDDLVTASFYSFPFGDDFWLVSYLNWFNCFGTSNFFKEVKRHTLILKSTNPYLTIPELKRKTTHRKSTSSSSYTHRWRPVSKW